MASLRHGVLLTAITVCAWGQAPAPSISREGILPARGPQWLEPGQFVAIYGRYLAPGTGCSEKLELKAGGYPTDVCDTHVTVNGIRAGLQFIGQGQINIKLPAGIPSAGLVAIAVVVQGVSTPEITVPIGKPKLTLSVAGHAYVHMPVWIAHNVPVPWRDPILFPADMGGGKFEVRRNGVMLKPLEIPKPGGFGGSFGGTPISAEPLPLHLQYRFDEPGRYEIRFTGTRTEQSDWTPIEIEPFSEAQRAAWIRERARAIPELLALPDAAALSLVLPQLYHPEESVRRYVSAALPMFDDAVVAKQLTPLVREKGPTGEIASLLHQKENLFEGGHEAFLALLPGFLNSSSPVAQAGALQYIVWEPNHDWGKEPQFQARRTALVMNAAPGIVEHGDAHLQQLLALALGSIKTEASRAMLWRMIDAGKAAEQSTIALTWIGDVRDLPRLAASMDVSLAYSLHHGYGDAALPWLRKTARETDRPALRLACAKELVFSGEPEGFQFLLQAMNDSPSVSNEAVQFARDQFPELHDANQGKVLEFVRARAAGAR